MEQRARILFACEASARTEALGEVLRAMSCDVEHVSTAAQILECHDADALVVDERLEYGRAGLELCEELHDAGSALPVVFVARGPELELCGRLSRLGVRAMIDSFDPQGLARSLEELLEDSLDAKPAGPRLERSYFANEFTVRRALNDLTTFLDVSRVAPPHTARIACATAEVLDNVLRHACCGGSERQGDSFTVQAEVRGASVRVAIRDSGRGFDVERVRLETVPAALPGLRKVGDDHGGGLERAARLSEALNLTSDPSGSTIELAFELTLAAIDRDDDGERSISADDFHPRPLRRLVASLRRGTVPWEEVPSVMTPTLERLLGGARAPRKPVVSR